MSYSLCCLQLWNSTSLQGTHFLWREMTVLEKQWFLLAPQGSAFWTHSKYRAKIFHGLSRSESPQTFNYPSITASCALKLQQCTRVQKVLLEQKIGGQIIWEAAWVSEKKTPLWNISHCNRWVGKQEKNNLYVWKYSTDYPGMQKIKASRNNWSKSLNTKVKNNPDLR